MKETTPAAMPPCFERWCQRFDDIFGNIAQKREFRNYLGGLLGESERKNISQMAANAVGVTYYKLHHFLTAAPWSFSELNQRRLEVMNQCHQTKISRRFSLIIDDSGHRKSGNFTEVVGRQYIGEIGKTENGVVAVTSHLYDGIKSLPLDVELYQKADSLPGGKADPEFKKKPEIAIDLIDQSNVDWETATGEWLVKTYSQRNWVEVFYREAKGWLGLKEYQVRDKRSLMRHLVFVFCAYTFILWHTKTGGLRRRWANKPLNTFTDALEAFRTAISFRFVKWLTENRDVFSAYKASLGFVWA